MSTARHGKKKNREFTIISWVSNDLIFVKHKLIDLEKFLRVQILTGRSKISEWTISSPMESIHAYFYCNRFTREPKYYVLRLTMCCGALGSCWVNTFRSTSPLHSNMWRTSLSLLSSMFGLLISSYNSAFIPRLFEIVSEDSSICWSWADDSTWVRYLVNLLWTWTL